MSTKTKAVYFPVCNANCPHIIQSSPVHALNAQKGLSSGGISTVKNLSRMGIFFMMSSRTLGTSAKKKRAKNPATPPKPAARPPLWMGLVWVLGGWRGEGMKGDKGGGEEEWGETYYFAACLRVRPW